MSGSMACRLRVACAALTLVALAGCTSWHVLSGTDVERLSAVTHVGDTVRATTATNGTQELEITSFADDTLRGVTPTGKDVQLRAADLKALEYRAPSRRKTVWLVIGAVLGAGFLDAYHSCEPEGPWGAPACAE